MEQAEDTMKTDPVIKLSVQGSYFELDRESFLKHDWMPATMLQSDMGKATVSGALFLDCDSVSFRMIWSLLQGVSTVSEAANQEIPTINLLISTAKYLCCNELVEHLGEVLDIEKLKGKALEEMRAEINSLKNQLETHSMGKMKLERLWSPQVPRTAFQITCHNNHRNFIGILCGTYTHMTNEVLGWKCDKCKGDASHFRCQPLTDISEIQNTFKANGIKLCKYA